jgi:hypothetical protein
MNEIFREWMECRPNYKTLAKWNPALIQPIIDRHPTIDNKISGFIHRTIVGDPGYGKSTYCYKFMAKLDYEINGYTRLDDEENSYKFALNNMIYRPDDLFSRILIQRNLGEPDWIWTLDDASVHMGRQLFDQDRPTYRKLQSMVPTIREDVTCLFITTPMVNLLAKPLREFLRRKMEMHVVENIKSYQRLGKHYEKRYYPDDIRFRMHNPYNDKFSCLIPEPFYKWYLDKKRKALKDYAESVIRKPVIFESDKEEGENVES